MANSNPYYLHPFLSNSRLTKLSHEISGADLKEYTQAFRRGTVLDAYITQPQIRGELNLTLQEMEFGLAGFKIFTADNYCQLLHRYSRTQWPFYKENIKFKFNGVEFSHDCKCLYDGIHAPVLGWDIKHTQATSQKAFEEACHHFQYFRGRAWYMNLSGLKRDMIIGVNVERGLLFKVPITFWDENHQLGVKQYTELAYKYWALNFDKIQTDEKQIS